MVEGVLISLPRDHDDLVDSTTQAIVRFRQGGLVMHPEDYDDEKDKQMETCKKLLLMAKNLSVVPMSLKEANDFVTKYHRHNKKCAGHKFSIGAMEGDRLVGVAIIGRPLLEN